jgi:signal transduction histidine kinase/CheY-like chemotaxis protein
MTRLVAFHIAHEEDVVAARQRARHVADALGFDAHDQTRIATAVSEIARNAVRYGGGGRVDFSLDVAERVLLVTVSDAGPGIPHLHAVLSGSYNSGTGMGLGIIGSRRVMDEFDISATPNGTTVRMGKRLPRRNALSNDDAGRIAARLASEEPLSVTEEMLQQNHELLATLEELRVRQEELTRLNLELQDTNRGVLALYAELDEKAEHLRRADDMKSKFLSNMTHEFQTPLNSILALTRLLLDEADGELSPEQEKQVTFIRGAATELAELVHDLLDLAKVEAGKVSVHPTEFAVPDLFGALRGLMRPLQTNEAVALVFKPAHAVPTLYTDEAKVSQVLRNYVSNALKFTERGEVIVSASLEEPGSVLFLVRDTGIGIAPEDHGRLFQEFGQIPNRLQANVRGTGLGLSLSKRLAELLGGEVGVTSAVEEGSTFWLRIPVVAPGFEATAPQATVASPPQPSRIPTALVVDDQQTARYVLRRYLTQAGCRVIEANGGREGLARATAEQPDVVFLDIMMPDMLGTEVLARLKRNAATAHIPVVIATSGEIDEAERARLSAHAAAILAKARIGGPTGLSALREALLAAGIQPHAGLQSTHCPP